MAVWEKFDPKESNALEGDPAEDGPAAPFCDPYSKLLSYRDFPSDPGRARACDPRWLSLKAASSANGSERSWGAALVPAPVGASGGRGLR
jgi:hypothetical protein